MLVPIRMSTSMASPYKSLSIWVEYFFRYLVNDIPVTWILTRVFAYLSPFISQILDFIYWTVLIFIFIYFELRDTENQRARMGSESIAYEAEGRMGYWLSRGHEGKE